ncbi:MAG: sugar phosphate isomerase/epimerase family protein [Ktedonobacterales bacterium]
MRISLSTATLYHRGLGYTLALAHDAGFDGVELAVGLDYAIGGQARVTRLVAESGVPVLSIHPPMVRFPGWPRLVSHRVARLAALGSALDARVLVLHSPMISGPRSARAKRYAQALRVGQTVAAGSALMLAIETNQYDTRTQRFYLDDLATLTEFARDHGCGVTLDTCHEGANGGDLLAAYEIVRPVLLNVHLSDVVWQDGLARTHRLPGAGALPLRELLRRMARDGYDGLMTLEVHPKFVPLLGRQRQLAVLREAVGFVRAAITQPVVEAEAAEQPRA